MAKRIIGRHKAFLKAFATCGSITRAARAAGVDRGQHYEWLKEREGYADAFADAVSEAAAGLEDLAVERATKGVYEPNIWQGEFVYPESTTSKPRLDPFTGTQARDPQTNEGLFDEETKRAKKPLGVWKKSDALLMFLLKGLKPERYRDRVSAEVTGKDGGPISLEQKRLTVLTDDELAQLIAVAKKLASDPPDGSGSPPAKQE
jgi:hypothetical protein